MWFTVGPAIDKAQQPYVLSWQRDMINWYRLRDADEADRRLQMLVLRWDSRWGTDVPDHRCSSGTYRKAKLVYETFWYVQPLAASSARPAGGVVRLRSNFSLSSMVPLYRLHDNSRSLSSWKRAQALQLIHWRVIGEVSSSQAPHIFVTCFSRLKSCRRDGCSSINSSIPCEAMMITMICGHNCNFKIRCIRWNLMTLKFDLWTPTDYHVWFRLTHLSLNFMWLLVSFLESCS